jgi:hypothetical protein
MPSVSGKLQNLHKSHILPDVESSSLFISRSLLPVVHKLKWSLQKDRLAKMLRDHACVGPATRRGGERAGFSKWLETRGRGIVQEGEKVRLAICPDIRQIIGFYEDLARDV